MKCSVSPGRKSLHKYKVSTISYNFYYKQLIYLLISIGQMITHSSFTGYKVAALLNNSKI